MQLALIASNCACLSHRGFSMSAPDIDRTIELLWDLDIDVNMCLTGELAPSVLVPRILETCKRIREHQIDDEAEHSVQALEQLAQEFSIPLARAYTKQRLPLASADRSQLIRGIYELRMQLLKSRSSGQ